MMPKKKKGRELILLKQTYAPRTTVWNGPDKFPKLPQIAAGFDVVRVDLLADGHMEMADGQVLAFQDVRLFAVGE
jgi:hypothetical protein